MKLEITIPNYRAKSRNQTLTGHWSKYKNARDEISSFMLAYAEKVKRIEPAHVTIEAYYKGKRHVDTSNLDDKLIVDGLQHLLVLSDDTAYQNPIVTKMVFPESGEDKLVITVLKVEK